MERLQVLRSDQVTQWMDILEQSSHYDFYHLPRYHALAEERGEGKAHMFVYREGAYSIGLPLLLRPILSTPGLEQIGDTWWDATSVYGYAGPIASHEIVPSSLVDNFRLALCQALQDRRVVAVFSRLHPLLRQRHLFARFGQITQIGQTVSIDLTLPADVQRGQYRKNHKHDINRLRRLGVLCHRDVERHHLSQFIDIYYETMRRVKAPGMYFFEREYFEKLMAALGSNIQLFVCELGRQIICGGLFVFHNQIVQYHLGATSDNVYELSPSKLLFDTVRLWAMEQGASIFHLGGGFGGKEDSLFHFKKGFSNSVHNFAVWRGVLLPDIYEQLCRAKADWNHMHGLHREPGEYFPQYRSPTIRRQLSLCLVALCSIAATIAQLTDIAAVAAV
jgi:hypothetical protein